MLAVVADIGEEEGAEVDAALRGEDEECSGLNSSASVTYSGLLHPPSGAERRREASFPSDGSTCV
ncbi:hypothetical protein [Streptomyces sp. WMMC905]|uniref:hypothetical protein n=1 Tax=Streptomyces sp. WMMC905 TaxID=3404123 RepID=UPI003B9240BC